MRKISSMLLFILMFSCSVFGQVKEVEHHSAPQKIGQYVKTHKIVLIADALTILAWSADAASSVHCQNVSRGCIETNGTLGKHPSPAATWGYAMGFSSVIVTANHMWWWATGKYDEKDLRLLMFLWNGPFVITEVFNVQNNVKAAEELEKARTRVMTK